MRGWSLLLCCAACKFAPDRLAPVGDAGADAQLDTGVLPFGGTHVGIRVRGLGVKLRYVAIYSSP